VDKVLVLGANGFLGSHVVDFLIENNYYVRAFDIYNGQKPRFNTNNNIEIFDGNFLNISDISESLKDIDYVMHLISTTNPASAESDPLIDIDTNIRGSIQLFKEIISNGNIKKIIYSSSGGTVYGDNQYNRPIKETDLAFPISPYGIGKLTIENYLHYFNIKFGQKYSVFRIANPYGSRQQKGRKQGVIPIFMDNILSNKPITVLGDGSMVRDYIFVKDVANMIVSTLQKKANHSVYNLGSGIGHDINEIISEIENVTSIEANIIFKKTPATFVHSSVLDMERYINDFGKYNFTSLDAGIKELYKYSLKEYNE
jgi:UDP-glucose 4-epimerase